MDITSYAYDPDADHLLLNEDSKDIKKISIIHKLILRSLHYFLSISFL